MVHWRRVSVSVLLSVLPLMTASVAQADPALTPPLPPDATNARCVFTGHGALCSFDRVLSDPGPNLFFSCNGFDIMLSNDIDVQHVKRVYNRAGLLVEADRHNKETGVLGNSKTGKGLALTGHFREDFVFATPGDTTAGIETVTGQLAKVTAPGRGIVFLDSGITVSRFSPTGGVDLFQSGRHDLTTGNVSQLCAALL